MKRLTTPNPESVIPDLDSTQTRLISLSHRRLAINKFFQQLDILEGRIRREFSALVHQSRKDMNRLKATLVLDLERTTRLLRTF